MRTIKHILIFSIVILFGLQDGNAQSSVLSEGLWYRVTVSENGIYKIRYEDLLSKGVLEKPANISKIALFGGLNGAIPLENFPDETFDLQEIAIFLVDINGDGQFGNGDYILFYGQSPHRWTWNLSQQKYTRQTNVFTREMSYFFTTDFSGNGKRLQNKPNQTNPTIQITNFRDHFRHERDLENPFKSSQEWYDRRMDRTTPFPVIDLTFHDLISDSNVNIQARIVVNEPAMVVMSANNNNNRRDTLFVRRTRGSNVFMLDTIRNFSWNFVNERPSISLEYTGLSNNSSGWAHLDYLEFHYRRRLSLANTAFQFRFVDYETSEIGNFTISSANSTTQVWDISNPLEPQKIQQTTSGNTFSFASSLAGRPEFIAFSDNHINSITQFEKVKKQNLHGKDSIEYVMVVHDTFLLEAERLAAFHRSRNLNVLVVTPTEVFNEFSYGRQDPMAIRRMMRHYRNKAIEQGSDVLPKYLLLFGSPSYDYLDRAGRVQNFVLNYQFPTGLIEGQSFATDDFFGFLKDGETGFLSGNSLQIGIGRFPARDTNQARTLVNKTIDYATPSSRTFGDWRNIVTNLADDGITENFVETYEDIRCVGTSEECRERIRNFEPRNSGYFAGDTNFTKFNIEKIYIDAFPQVATPSGARYPAAKEALKQRIERGTLLLNYQGHSGRFVLADEDLMNISDIQNFGNISQFMVFFTASCNFAQYDDPAATSGGEWSVLSPRGGAVVHIGSSRIAYTSPNDGFHGAFNHFALLRHDNGNARSLGETMKLSKNRMGNVHNLKQFVFLGDPAISLALPKFLVVTDSINGNSVQDGIDTIKALDRASIAGRIVNFDNNILSDFTGEINITVFDKPVQRETLGQRNSTVSNHNPVIPFKVQQNILFRGRVPVIDGKFRVEFMSPKDINYNFGFGKISYYAFSDSVDATGVFDSVIIGGFGKNFELV
ncbi:MAG: type IX secretion system sortase PorU, partial [Bacteroidales bacterium]|nr:type IX secretion system sortase PorU [Bacteroidales bacterium]